MKPIRFLPLVALAAFALLALKLAGMMVGEDVMLTGTRQTLAKADSGANAVADKTANKEKKTSGNGAKEATNPGDKGNPAEKSTGKKRKVPRDIASILKDDHRSRAEISLLTSLSKRRKELDRREQELDMRASLIKAARKRIDERIVMLKGLEEKIQRFAKRQKEQKKKQFDQLVKMYSAMKPKGAALIFNELDKNVLLGIIQNMKPQTMSAILAAMSPSKAREITIALAGETRKKITENSLNELPGIEGQ